MGVVISQAEALKLLDVFAHVEEHSQIIKVATESSSMLRNFDRAFLVF